MSAGDCTRNSSCAVADSTRPSCFVPHSATFGLLQSHENSRCSSCVPNSVSTATIGLAPHPQRAYPQPGVHSFGATPDIVSGARGAQRWIHGSCLHTPKDGALCRNLASRVQLGDIAAEPDFVLQLSVELGSARGSCSLGQDQGDCWRMLRGACRPIVTVRMVLALHPGIRRAEGSRTLIGTMGLPGFSR